MLTNTSILIASDQAKRVFVDNGVFSSEKPPSFLLERATVWPSFMKKALRSQAQLGRRAFSLWTQIHLGKVFHIEDTVLLRKLWKNSVLLLFSIGKTWKDAKRCLRRTLILAQNDLAKAISNMRLFLKRRWSSFSPFNKMLGVTKDTPVPSVGVALTQRLDRIKELSDLEKEITSDPSRGRVIEFVNRTSKRLESRSGSRIPRYVIKDKMELSSLLEFRDSSLVYGYYEYWDLIFKEYSPEGTIDSLKFIGHIHGKGPIDRKVISTDTACDLPTPKGWTPDLEFVMNALLEYGQRESSVRVDLSKFKQLRYFFLEDPKLFSSICKSLSPSLVIPPYAGKKPIQFNPLLPEKLRDFKVEARDLKSRSERLIQLAQEAKRLDKPILPEEERLQLKEFTRFPSDLFVEVRDFMEQNKCTFKDYVLWKRAHPD